MASSQAMAIAGRANGSRHCARIIASRCISRRDPWEPSFSGWSVDLQPRRSRHVSGPNHHGTRAAEPETPHGIASRSTKPLFFNDIDRWVFRCAVVEAEPGANPSLGLGNALIGIEVDFLVFEAAPQPLELGLDQPAHRTPVALAIMSSV